MPPKTPWETIRCVPAIKKLVWRATAAMSAKGLLPARPTLQDGLVRMAELALMQCNEPIRVPGEPPPVNMGRGVTCRASQSAGQTEQTSASSPDSSRTGSA